MNLTLLLGQHNYVEPLQRLLPSFHEGLEPLEVKLTDCFLTGLLHIGVFLETWTAVRGISLLHNFLAKLSSANAHRVKHHLVLSQSACLICEHIVK